MICELLLIFDDLCTQRRRRFSRIVRAQRLEFAKQLVATFIKPEMLSAKCGALFTKRQGSKVGVF